MGFIPWVLIPPYISGEKERLFDPLEEIDGAPPKLLDDLDIDSEGNIYWSDASINADLSDGIIEMLSDPSGRCVLLCTCMYVCFVERMCIIDAKKRCMRKRTLVHNFAVF